MSLRDVRTSAQKRVFANGIAVLTVLMISAVWLEHLAGWEFQQIMTSLLSFGLVLAVSVGRFALRNTEREQGNQKRLFITVIWYWIIDRIAAVLPESRSYTKPSRTMPDEAKVNIALRNSSVRNRRRVTTDAPIAGTSVAPPAGQDVPRATSSQAGRNRQRNRKGKPPE